jgi:flagellar basal-body rod protein FlgF
VIYGLYQSAAGMLVNQYRQDVTANNLANVDTVGFKRDIPSFSERLVESQMNRSASRNPVLDGQTGGVWSAPTYTDWQTGPADVTGNNLDAAITGRGFFAVQAEGGVRYTRDGQFTINSQGQLVTTQDGLPVLNQQGSPITLGDDAKTVSLTPDGKVMVNGQPVADLQVAGFDDLSGLHKVGRNLVASDAQPRMLQPNLRVKTVEKSNVDAMTEMASMIEASRAYQINAQMVTIQDSTLTRLLSEVARPAT